MPTIELTASLAKQTQAPKCPVERNNASEILADRLCTPPQTVPTMCSMTKTPSISMSTTGVVWISEDSGDSCEHLNAELPPVYCVRFGKLPS